LGFTNSAATLAVVRPSLHFAWSPSRAESGRNSASAITRWNCRRWRTELILGGNRLGLAGRLCGFAKETRGFESFIVDFVKGWNAVIPLEQSGGMAAQLDGMGVQLHTGSSTG